MTTFRQRSYIVHALKTNRNMYLELKDFFPDQIKDGVNNVYADLEIKLSKLDLEPVLDVIGMLKEDKIVKGFKQLEYLIKQ